MALSQSCELWANVVGQSPGYSESSWAQPLLSISCSGGSQRHRPRALQLHLRWLGGAHPGYRLQAPGQDGLRVWQG